MRGMFGGITVIVMIGGLINLGRFQIRYGVVVVVMVVVVTAVGMAVMSATVLEDEDSHQIHDKSHDGDNEEPFMLNVWWFEDSLDRFGKDEESDEEKEETIDEAGDNLSANVTVGKRLGRLPS